MSTESYITQYWVIFDIIVELGNSGLWTTQSFDDRRDALLQAFAQEYPTAPRGSLFIWYLADRQLWSEGQCTFHCWWIELIFDVCSWSRQTPAPHLSTVAESHAVSWVLYWSPVSPPKCCKCSPAGSRFAGVCWSICFAYRRSNRWISQSAIGSHRRTSHRDWRQSWMLRRRVSSLEGALAEQVLRWVSQGSEGWPVCPIQGGTDFLESSYVSLLFCTRFNTKLI